MSVQFFARCRRTWRLLSRRSAQTRAYLKDESGVAGLVIAMIIMIVASSALTVFLSKYTGPARDLAQIRSSGENEKWIQAGLVANFNRLSVVPCPDLDRNGTADTCTGGATTSGTLPWLTMGMSPDDAIDPYGTYYTYVVANVGKEFCVSVGNDYNTAAAAEFTGEVATLDDLRVIATTPGAVERYVPFALISHGENRLGGISSSNTSLPAPTSATELVNATANPTTVYTGPNDSTEASYFDDTVWTLTAAQMTAVCGQKTPGGALNADVTADFNAVTSGNAIDSTKFDTATGGTPVQQVSGQAVFSDATAYMTTAASNIQNSTERPVYITAEWTPDAAATNGGFSIVTRAEATPTAGVFDPGITFQFFSGAGAAGSNTISIMNDGAQVAGFTSADATFTMTFGQTYLLEVYDNGDDVWMQITQKNLTTNRAYAYAANLPGDTGGTRVALVNGTGSVSRLDNLTIGRPMIALDTRGTGYVETTGNTNGTGTGSITLEGWFKPRSLPTGSNTATLISQWDSASIATTGSYRLFMTSGGALSLALRSTTVTDTEVLGAALTADKWTHVAVTYDQAPTYGAITVYIDGELVNTITGTVTAQILAGGNIRAANEHFVVGANLIGAAGENIFDGLVSDVRVWTDIRTAQEISTWYDQRLPLVDGADTIHTGLAVNWRFDLESGGFAATQALRYPTTIGSVGVLQPTGTPANLPAWTGAMLFTNRPDSTDICASGTRVGAFRCDFRTATPSAVTITGQTLAALPSFYAKVWGGGGGRDTSPAPANAGGGGGFAGGLFVNSGANISYLVGRGGTTGTSGGNGVASYLTQGTPRVTGGLGIGGGNSADGNSGIGSITGTLTTSVIAPSVASINRRPGCVPTIAVVGDACTDPHYTMTFSIASPPTSLPGYGADAPTTVMTAGQTGAVILLW